MEPRQPVTVLGVGNVLWADEGFGVRAVEALHAAWEFPAEVELLDGGTLGLFLAEYVEASARLLLLDAIDFGLPPGSLRVIRGADVPAWGATKLSPHQTGFNDILAFAAMRGVAPGHITLIGVQPENLSDFGGSLRPVVRARLDEAIELAAGELAAWGFAGRRRVPGEAVAPLHDGSLSLEAYETGRPSEEEACRVGDPRVLAMRGAAGRR